ncbi:hypothetical protein LOTGIDRAFT_204891 [Lottia gigantea]|uniref:Glutathione transferase n=1 Tax=Lottia gigantea TaxID=225164 RepID=V3ZNZ5_LOTGI|nr:hypothetical protein LOTGIDRAFT_204891 [Lottia gigantea]ESO82571.1 hypothetical protein LOTGIDRAFT_204891 [Lottia gigantea]
MTKYRLHRFNVWDRGALVKLVFKIGGQEYEEVAHEYTSWKQGTYRAIQIPLGKLPLLEIDGKTYTQSGALAVYLSKQFGFYGKDDIERLKIDTVTGLMNDFYPLAFQALYYEKDEQIKAKLQERLYSEDIPKFYTTLEKILAENRTGYFVGSSLSLADIEIYDATTMLLSFNSDIIKDYDLVQQIVKKVEQHSNLVK